MAGARMTAPLWVLEHGHGKAAAGLAAALFALGQIFLLLPAGRFADRHGLQRPLRLCVVAATLGLGLSAIWPSLWALCITAPMVGAAAGVAHLSLQRHVGRAAASPAQLRQAFSWLSIGPAAANFAGPMVAGITIDLAGFHAAFGLLCLLPLVAWLLMRKVPEAPSEAAPAGERSPAWELLRDPSIRRMFFINWVLNASFDLHSFMVPVLGHERDLPAAAIGGILGTFALGAMAVRLAMPALGPRVPEWVWLASACAVTGTLLLIYPFAPGAWAMALCSATMGLAFGSVQPMVTSMLYQLTPRHRQGEALAMRLTMINVSMFAMPTLLGIVSSAVGVGPAFWVLGLLVCGSSPLSLKLRHLGEGGHAAGDEQP
jgi:predicted MFS family arabinose efflux permease